MSSSWCFGKVSMWGRGHSNCNASLSQQNVQKKAEPMWGGGGLKTWKKNAEKETKHYLKMDIISLVFCTFSFTPNPITQAQYGSSLGLSFLFLWVWSGEGKGYSNYIIALRLLDYMGFAMEAKKGVENEVGHTLQPHSLGTGDKCPHPPIPNFRVLFGTGRGQKVFYPPRPDYRRFKIPSFTSLGHTHSHGCAPTATFSFCRILGNPLSSRARNYNASLELRKT